MTLVNAIKPIDSIVIGKRVRQDAGDLDALADSLARLGLLHPIVVAPTDDLLAGWRRLEAAKLLGWTEVSVRVATTVADYRAALQIESEENAQRKDFTPSEAEAMSRAILAIETPKAKERQGRPGKPRSAKFAEQEPEAAPAPRAIDVAAEHTGYSTETLRKAAAVVDAAANTSLPQPVRAVAAEAVTEMDATGKVDPAYKKTQAAIGAHVAEVMPELVDAAAGREASKAIRRLLTDVKVLDPEAAAAGTRESQHLDMHIEKADRAIAWLTTYRRGLTGLALVQGGQG